MAILCAPPDPALGVVLRLSRYLDCEGRALGENGFQALIGSAAWTSILLAAVTIFVALIGYRMMLGRLPSMGDGIGWAVRLGIVLTLVTGWSAFQALFYQLSVDGPREIAATILPPARLSPTALPERLQDTYDRLRLGAFWTAAATPPPASDPAVSPAISGAPDGAPPVAVPFGGAGQTRLPQTALLLAITTAGVVGGLEMASGLLLAIGPLAALCLLFDATLGLFSGWIRALAGAGVGLLASTATTLVTLGLLDAEFTRLDRARFAVGAAREVDPGALTVTVAIGAVLTLVGLIAAFRTANAFRLTLPSLRREAELNSGVDVRTSTAEVVARGAAAGQAAMSEREVSRATAVARTLEVSVQRDAARAGSTTTAQDRAAAIGEASARDRVRMPMAVPLGVAGRRSVGRATRSAARRDRIR